jgi:hypothetical protein
MQLVGLNPEPMMMCNNVNVWLVLQLHGHACAGAYFKFCIVFICGAYSYVQVYASVLVMESLCFMMGGVVITL